MKFLLKQLKLFFPFVFPIYDIEDSGGASPLIRITLKNRALKEEIEELKARVQKLEEKLAVSEKRRKDPEKYFWMH